MKRIITLVVLLFFANLSISSGNPFTEVPKKHWSYDSIRHLQQAGIIDKSEATVYSDRQLTRIEMAELIAHGLVYREKATGLQKIELDKLSLEFKEELESLGVFLEDFADDSNVKISGDVRIRYTNKDTEKISKIFG